MTLRRFPWPVSACAFVAIACSAPDSSEGPTGRVSSPIVYGTIDTADTAVVALLAADQGGYDECSGTIVQVKNGAAYILTSAHCCSTNPPTLVVMGNDYSGGVQYIGAANPAPPAYAVIAGSVKYDPDYVASTTTPAGDFCMLKMNAPANTPVIPVATGPDNLVLDTTVEFVGYGITESNANNTRRRVVTASVDQSVTAQYFRYSVGTAGHLGGPCEGDTGGPALVAGVGAEAPWLVVGTTSFGDANCTQYGVSMRVTSETGPGGFISTYLADGPIASLDGGPGDGGAVTDGSSGDGPTDSGSLPDGSSSGDGATEGSPGVDDGSIGGQDAASDGPSASVDASGDELGDRGGDASTVGPTGDDASDNVPVASQDSGQSTTGDNAPTATGGGCGCHTADATSGGSPWLASIAGLLLVAARRRRRPASAP